MRAIDTTYILKISKGLSKAVVRGATRQRGKKVLSKSLSLTISFTSNKLTENTDSLVSL